VAHAVLEKIVPGDLVITLGAGDITHVSTELTELLSK
jgi:UDP-N-acetylmuramate-alanine ligase